MEVKKEFGMEIPDVTCPGTKLRKWGRISPSVTWLKYFHGYLSRVNNTNMLVAASGPETMARCFVCHSICFRFDLLHGRKFTLTHVCASKRQVHF